MRIGSPLSNLLVGASLLVIGGAGGITLDRSLHGGGLHRLAAPLHMTTEEHRGAAIEQLHSVLQLDPAQAQQIDSTIHAHQLLVEEGWHDVHSQVEAAMDSVHEHLRAILTPEQWERFVEWAADQQGGTPH